MSRSPAASSRSTRAARRPSIRPGSAISSRAGRCSDYHDSADCYAGLMWPVALTIAGSDPSGGAGIQADLKTFHQLGVYGMSVLTLLTVQNTRRLDAVEVLSADFVGAQLDAVLEDIPPQAAKTGALGSSEVIR